jgi:oxygen-independent coproporphyrinogen-3 oxidase
LTLTPDRLALYNFAYIPRLKPQQKLIEISDLPESDEKLFLFADATEAFLDAGYEYIGMDHFAKPEDELSKARIEGTLQRNFQGYSTRADCNLLGLGMSAISHINGTFSQNEKSLDQYYQKLDLGNLPVRAGLAMSFDDSVREHVIMRLMCDLRLDKRTVSYLFDITFDDYFTSSIDQLCQFETDGLVILTPNSIEITSKGRFFIRNIAMCFDAYLEKEPKHQPQFSRTL